MEGNLFPNKTAKQFHYIDKIVYLCLYPNIWGNKIHRSKFGEKIHSYLTKFIQVIIFILILSELGSIFTQQKLTEKQKFDRVLFSYAHPSFYISCSVMYFNINDIKKVINTLAIDLKTVFNDTDIENEMIKSINFCVIVFVCITLSSLIFYGLDGIVYGSNLTIFITMWPDADDTSYLANAVKIATYIIMWIFFIRICAAYVIVISLIICLSYQYKNLQKYFFKLNDIFRSNMEQSEKEMKYEEALQIGIELHSVTLRCTNQVQKIGNVIFSTQIMISVLSITLLIFKILNSERNLFNVLAILSVAFSVLIAIGISMCKAGDITYEASQLSTFIYTSGWHNCMNLPRIKLQLTIAILQAQQPVVLRGFYFIELSYQSYVTILKSSYSLFSVIY